MKIDPATGWPFFVDHGLRRTTWDDPRYGMSHTSAGASFQNYPGNPYPSKQGRCHEITNIPLSHHPSIQSTFEGKIPILANNTLTEQSMTSYPRNALRTPVEAGNVQSRGMENSADRPGHSTSSVTPVSNTVGTHGTASNSNGSRATDPQDFTINDSLKQTYPEIKQIGEIMEKSIDLEKRVLSYNGTVGTKDYVFLEESLMAILLLLDKVETHGNSEIRRVRKSAVCKIQQLLATLENKAKGIL